MQAAIDIKNWNLSPGMVELLTPRTDLLAILAKERSKQPFPPGYTPSVVDIVYEDWLFLRSERGQVTYLRNCPKTYLTPCLTDKTGEG